MGAIIAALAVLQDQPASRWPLNKAGLTLNAFVSILSRIAGAALLLPVAEALGQLKWIWFIRGDSKKMWDFEMFDNASRGPWGALLLLIHTKGKTIAALGALVTIFALALDPFFQQVVSFPEDWTLQEANSSIARAVRYEPEISIDYVNGLDIINLDQHMTAVTDPFFVGNGTQPIPFGNGSRVDFPLACPSSNCTWPTYDTLGVCSKCVEVPKLLEFACIYTTVDWTSTLNMCGYFLNSTSVDPILMSGYMVDNNGKPKGEALLMRTLPLLSNPLREPLWGAGTINFKEIRNPIVDVLISSSAEASDVFANKPPVLQECVLAWCVKTVKSSYYVGTYKEDVTSTMINNTSGPQPWSATKLEDGSTYTDYLENVTIAAPSTGKNFSQWGWGVNNDTMFQTVVIFDRMFPAFTTVGNDSQRVLRWKTGHPTEVRTKRPDFNPWLLPNNITQHMDRLVEAMTNVIRSSSSSELITGDAFDNEVYVRVRWAWLSLPLGLLLISCVFLLATVIKSGIEKESGKEPQGPTVCDKRMEGIWSNFLAVDTEAI
ncbi:hypothetical protein SNOG_06475 [Parastagonospora nodorum SN15]|uniref:Uncharacterized protein n=1 Tax=Phaeosphaeria nodorum (strain SN15 / ATCC MYA-4574 / FGSC 10173) TaxID=321614 RepID=Q0UP39_PHANO|nr:hypothetical protein SNOG_06475 [Parastagonospora nodorum SN15]EAT86306.2 hypothetical protein SNOG_06475 [Parastagonospora nodorum SN15]